MYCFWLFWSNNTWTSLKWISKVDNRRKELTVLIYILWGKDKPGLTDAKVKEGLFFCCPCVNLQQVAWGKSWSAATMLHYGPNIYILFTKPFLFVDNGVPFFFWDHEFSLEAISDGFNFVWLQFCVISIDLGMTNFEYRICVLFFFTKQISNIQNLSWPNGWPDT